jgi:cGMP-dependent protein kinase
MILVLEYLFSQGIIYRDLKPENFIVGMDGYLKLIDLVASKVIKGKSLITSKTYTLIGTPHYMAPEIIIGKGYTFTISLYSLGINMF